MTYDIDALNNPGLNIAFLHIKHKKQSRIETERDVHNSDMTIG